MNILTFDVEEWFIMEDSGIIPHNSWQDLQSRLEQNIGTILTAISRHNIKATFFVLGWVAEHYPTLIRQIADAGHEIGYHSYYHMRPLHQEPAAFEDDLVKGLSLLEKVTGQKVKAYRAPNFSVASDSAWIYPILAKHGITVSSSVKAHRSILDYRVQSRPFRIKTCHGDIFEFPLNRVRLPGFSLVYSGSGYLRLLPYSLIRLLFSFSDYNMAYFHPRDFDLHFPGHRAICKYHHWRSSIKAETTMPKLNKLAETYYFNTLEEAHTVYKTVGHKTVQL